MAILADCVVADTGGGRGLRQAYQAFPAGIAT